LSYLLVVKGWQLWRGQARDFPDHDLHQAVLTSLYGLQEEGAE